MVWILGLLACRTEGIVYDGTLVGNAGSTRGKLAESKDHDCADPVVYVSQVRYLDSTGVENSLWMGTVDIFHQELALENGSHGIVELQIEEFALQCSVGGNETTYNFVGGTLQLVPQTALSATNYILELGTKDWLVAPNPTLLLYSASALFVDSNGDGVLQTEEATPVANGANRPIHVDTDEEVDEQTEDTAAQNTDTGTQTTDTADTDEDTDEDSGTDTAE